MGLGNVRYARLQRTRLSSDTIMTCDCDRTDPLSKLRYLSRWLLRPTDIRDPSGRSTTTVAVVGLAINDQTISRSDLEAIASSL
jgi:hypothetical protein